MFWPNDHTTNVASIYTYSNVMHIWGNNVTPVLGLILNAEVSPVIVVCVCVCVCAWSPIYKWSQLQQNTLNSNIFCSLHTTPADYIKYNVNLFCSLFISTHFVNSTSTHISLLARDQWYRKYRMDIQQGFEPLLWSWPWTQWFNRFTRHADLQWCTTKPSLVAKDSAVQ